RVTDHWRDTAETAMGNDRMQALIRRATSVGQGLNESASSLADPIRTATAGTLSATGAALTSGVEDVMDGATRVTERMAEDDRVQAMVNRAEIAVEKAIEDYGTQALIRRATSVGQSLNESVSSLADPIRTASAGALSATGAAVTSGVEDAIDRATRVTERIAENNQVQVMVNRAEIAA
ncbi:unnamed protein product, partial [Sphacelaria rigidula]